MRISEFVNVYEHSKNADTPENPVCLPFGLPNFQRNFTWKASNVEELFETMFLSFPLPLFFTLKLNERRNFPASKFLNDFDEATNPNMLNIPFSEQNYGDNTFLICDGQQRLTSVLIGFLGLKFESKYLCFLPQNEKVSNDSKWFMFKSERQIASKNPLPLITLNKFYDFYKTNFVLSIDEIVNESIQFFYEGCEFDEDLFSRNIKTLFLFFKNYELEFKNIPADVITDPQAAINFFVRINQGGKKLTKAELIFSILSGKLELEEDFPIKTELNQIIERYCGPGKVFKKNSIDLSNLIRSIIYLHFDELVWKPNVFENAMDVQEVIENWERIKGAINNTFSLIGSFNLGSEISSMNSLIPIMYHFYRNWNQELPEVDRVNMLRYLISVKYSGQFGNHNDELLKYLKRRQNDIYDGILPGEYVNFVCENLISKNYIPLEKNFTVEPDRIEEAFLDKDFNDVNNGLLSSLLNICNDHVTSSISNIYVQDINQIQHHLGSDGIGGYLINHRLKLFNYDSYIGENNVLRDDLANSLDFLEERKVNLRAILMDKLTFDYI